MGDCGNYDADVCVEFNLRKKGKNTEEESSEFLQLHKEGFIITKNINCNKDEIKKLYDEKIDFELSYKDWETWSSKIETLDEMYDAFDNYSDKNDYVIIVSKIADIVDIEKLDLELAKEFEITSIRESFEHNICILSVYDSIYCENDNSSQDSCDISEIKKYLDIPGSRLVLTGDGNGNC